MKLDHHISDLLHEHDCVIIPEFGGFVGNRKAAKIDTLRHKFSPPSKEITFNRSLTNNDGLLANRIAEKEQKDFRQANDIISTYVTRLRKSLAEENRAEIDKVGILHYDAFRNLRFEPDYTSNFLQESFGLTPIHSPEISRTAQPVVSELPALEKTAPEIPNNARHREITVKDHPPVRAERKKKKSLTYLPYVIAAIPLLFYLVWLPLNTDILKKEGTFTYSDLNPFGAKICPVYMASDVRTHPVILPEEADVMAIFNAPDTIAAISISLFDITDKEYSPDKAIIVRLRESLKAAPVSTDVAVADPSKVFRFHVIGGCFQYFENAEKLVDKLRKKGLNAAIIDQHRGLYRVSLQSYTTRQEALSGLSSLQQQYEPQAWLLVK